MGGEHLHFMICEKH